MKMAFRALTALAAPAGPHSRLSTFYFHRIPEKPDPLLPLEPDARTFDRILGWIGAQFRVLDPLEACERLYEGTLPSRPAIITFDDGYRDNYTVALPILQHHRMRAAFFISTGFLDGGTMFNDRVIEAIRHCPLQHLRLDLPIRTPGEVPSDERPLLLRSNVERRNAIDHLLRAIKYLELEERQRCVEIIEYATGRIPGQNAGDPVMMSAEQVADLSRKGMHLGGHTRTHPILARLAPDQARQEIEGGLLDLCAIAGKMPALFAYPNGRSGLDFSPDHADMLQDCKIRFAFTTDAGAAASSFNPYRLPRFTPWDRSEFRFASRALWNIQKNRSQLSQNGAAR